MVPLSLTLYLPCSDCHSQSRLPLAAHGTWLLVFLFTQVHPHKAISRSAGHPGFSISASLETSTPLRSISEAFTSIAKTLRHLTPAVLDKWISVFGEVTAVQSLLPCSGLRRFFHLQSGLLPASSSISTHLPTSSFQDAGQNLFFLLTTFTRSRLLSPKNQAPSALLILPCLLSSLTCSAIPSHFPVPRNATVPVICHISEALDMLFFLTGILFSPLLPIC
ncbi:uncharacterized protein LOC117287317 [Fukomys damarensis]|uniref:uncharacterized protein LOC117287317 n=1 Tax=Fukomys damarensis TaxID=885580 RepID=UPI0014554924|nr:uncharacterized protein LOC117287317 [Fukomys damarensis]